MPNVQHVLETRVAAAMRAAFPEAADAPPVMVPSQDPRFGDYQANGAMGLAKRLKKKPRDVAAEIVARLDVSDLAEKPEIAGPGFINFRLKSDWIAQELGRINPDDRLGVLRAQKPETVVVDYSAPNLAKEMHVGHLRSTIIGDALARMLDFAGHTVIRQNHVGDWGTQFGMLIAYMKRIGKERIDAHPELKDAELYYRVAKKLYDNDPVFAQEARETVVRLQKGDQELLERWKWLREGTLTHCRMIYKRLGVLLKRKDVRGESAYWDHLHSIVETLREKGLLVESEGAQCIFLNDEQGKPLFVTKDGDPLPLIVQKSDEGYLYATTDLAAIRYRVNELKAVRILYVVDARQSLHFQMLFACARQAGFAPKDTALIHIAFGTMLGADGKPFKTREGGTVKLMDLLDEAEKRAFDLVTQKNTEDVAAGRAQPLSEDERKDIARKVGIGAVKYADLAQNRTSDYVFSWEKMLSLDGNTAPYMQYAYARVGSIFRKGGHEADQHREGFSPIAVEAPAELALGKKILQFPETLDRALEDYRPNVLASYLFELAQAFTAFYDACPVIQSEEPVRSSRLKLCDLTARVIATGLGLLGIETADRM